MGAGGVREDKVEGDAATPAGRFPLRRIYFRNDRLVLPKVRLPARAINELLGSELIEEKQYVGHRDAE